MAAGNGFCHLGGESEAPVTRIGPGTGSLGPRWEPAPPPHTLPTLGVRPAGGGAEGVLESVSPGQGPLFSGQREGPKSPGRKSLDQKETPKTKRKGCEWICCCCSVAQSCLTLRPHVLQHTRPLCPPLSPGACSNSCPLSQGCRATISSSVVPFSSCLQSFPASRSFPMSQLFASGGQSTRVSTSTSVISTNIQG